MRAVQERRESRVGQLADELAEMRKEVQGDEKEKQGVGQGGGMVGWKQEMMREMRDMSQAASLPICHSVMLYVGRSVDRSLQMESCS